MSKHMADFQDILIELTGGTNPICSIKEIAAQMSVDTQTVYGYRSGKSTPNWDDGVRLSRYLIREHKYYRLAYQTLITCTGGKTNGRVEDEMLSLLGHGTDAHRAFTSDNESAFWSAYAEMESEMKTLKSEGKRKFS